MAKAQGFDWLTISVALGLTVSVADFVVHASLEGTVIETLPSLAAPFALVAAAAAASAAAGWLLGALAAYRRPGLDSQALPLAAAIAAVTPWIWRVNGWTTPRWASPSPIPYVFWPVFLVVATVIAYWVLERRASTAKRLLAAIPLALAPAALVQISRTMLGWQGLLLAAVTALAWISLAALLLRWMLRTPSARAIHLGVWGLAAATAAGVLTVRAGWFERIPSASLGASPSAARRIVLITIDTLRRDALGIYSDRPDSPRIDAFAREAIVFDEARSGAPWTHPAMAGLMTGLTPAGHGVHSQAEYIPAGIPMLAERLRDDGFRTIGVGHNWFLTSLGSGSRMNRGFLGYRFTPILPKPTLIALPWANNRADDPFDLVLSTEEIGRRAEEWLRRPLAGSFFLWVHFYDPHGPYSPLAEFAPEGDAPPRIGAVFSGRDLADFRAGRLEIDQDAALWIRKLYQAELRSVDRQVGRLLDAMRDAGIYDDTYIALTSDHGDEFFEHGGMDHGHTLYDELLRVPLMVKPPGAVEPRRVNSLVSTVALAPTLLDAAEIAYDPADFAFPALPLRPSDDAPQVVYSSGLLYGNQLEAVVFDRYKYIVDVRYGTEQLYDLRDDPGEMLDLRTTEVEALEAGRALLHKHALEAAERKRRHGIGGTPKRRLDRGERDLLKSLGYIQ